MIINSQITPLPKAPDMANPIEFDKDADKFVRAQIVFSNELNNFIKEANALSAFLGELDKDLRIFSELSTEELKSQTSLSILKIENFCKDFQVALEDKAKQRLTAFADECIQNIENKGYEMLERLNDNGVGADYIALAQNLAHNLNLEKFLMQRGFIRLRSDEAVSFDDVNDNFENHKKVLESLTNISDKQNKINLILKGANNG